MFVVALVVLALLLWRWFSRRKRGHVPAVGTEGEALASVGEEPDLAGAAALVSDNLKRVEGIGPRIASLLQEASITTFVELAATDVSRLEQILRDANITIADPGTWPEQANLAASGEWDRLKFLQDELKGGRRV